MTAKQKGILLEDLTWQQAEKILTAESVVVLPLGAALKEHGPHLKLNNDFILAEYLKNRILEQAEVVVLHTVAYHFYPAFVEYPGSVSVRLETARDLIVDICQSIARFGPRRFYVLNTGISTIKPLTMAAKELKAHGLLLTYSDLDKLLHEVCAALQEQKEGSHADEIETSMMLYIDPHVVDMSKAVTDYGVQNAQNSGGLTRVPGGNGLYSCTGVYGDARLARAEKGEYIIKALVDGILKDIAELRTPGSC